MSAHYELTSGRGISLDVTPSDILWLSRAVEAEGPPYDLVAQTLVNRWAWLRDSGASDYPTLESLVRAYARPVNPKWNPDGSLYLGYVARLAPSQANDAKRAAEVRRDIHQTRMTFSPHTTRAVSRALGGPLTLSPGIVHYNNLMNNTLPVYIAPSRGKNGFFGAADDSARGYRYHTTASSSADALSLTTLLTDFGPVETLAFTALAGWALYRVIKGTRR